MIILISGAWCYAFFHLVPKHLLQNTSSPLHFYYSPLPISLTISFLKLSVYKIFTVLRIWQTDYKVLWLVTQLPADTTQALGLCCAHSFGWARFPALLCHNCPAPGASPSTYCYLQWKFWFSLGRWLKSLAPARSLPWNFVPLHLAVLQHGEGATEKFMASELMSHINYYWQVRSKEKIIKHMAQNLMSCVQGLELWGSKILPGGARVSHTAAANEKFSSETKSPAPLSSANSDKAVSFFPFSFMQY